MINLSSETTGSYINSKGHCYNVCNTYICKKSLKVSISMDCCDWLRSLATSLPPVSLYTSGEVDDNSGNSQHICKKLKLKNRKEHFNLNRLATKDRKCRHGK